MRKALIIAGRNPKIAFSLGYNNCHCFCLRLCLRLRFGKVHVRLFHLCFEPSVGIIQLFSQLAQFTIPSHRLFKRCLATIDVLLFPFHLLNQSIPDDLTPKRLWGDASEKILQSPNHPLAPYVFCFPNSEFQNQIKT